MLIGATLPSNSEDRLATIKLQLTPPTRGMHRFKHQQRLYESALKFLCETEWKDVVEESERTGRTWIVLFAAFDIGRHRMRGAEFVPDVEGARRAETRAQAAGAKKATGRGRPASKCANKFIKASLRAELDHFKHLCHHVIRDECEPQQAKLFLASSKIADRRLRCLGIQGGRPTTNAILLTSSSESQLIAQAIAMHRVGASINNVITGLHKDDAEHSCRRVKRAKLNAQPAGKWKRQLREADVHDAGVQQGTTTDIPGYVQSRLKCNTCNGEKETKHMQLRTTYGYRAIQWVWGMQCTCGVWWHQCMLHRVSPIVHRVMKHTAAQSVITEPIFLPACRDART